MKQNVLIDSVDIVEYSAGQIQLELTLECRSSGLVVNVGLDSLAGLLSLAGVSKWSDLPGRAIRLLSRRDGPPMLGHIIREHWIVLSGDDAIKPDDETPLPGLDAEIAAGTGENDK